MRKLKMHLHISLDGYASDAAGGFHWVTYNDQIAARAKQLTANADAVVFGPKTYKGMQGYWPSVPNDPDATPGERPCRLDRARHQDRRLHQPARSRGQLGNLPSAAGSR